MCRFISMHYIVFDNGFCSKLFCLCSRDVLQNPIIYGPLNLVGPYFMHIVLLCVPLFCIFSTKLGCFYYYVVELT